MDLSLRESSRGELDLLSLKLCAKLIVMGKCLNQLRASGLGKS